MPTSISHIGGRARVNEPGRYRKRNNKNLMAQGMPTFIGMPQPLRNSIAKRVKPSQAISKKKKKKAQIQLRTTNNLVPCSAVIEAAALTGTTYTEDFPNIDIYGDGELYKLTVTVKKGSFRWSEAPAPTDYCNSQEGGAKWVGGFAAGDLELDMNGTFATAMYANYRVEFKFDKDLPQETGSIRVTLISVTQGDATATSTGGFGMDPVAAGVPTTKNFKNAHLTGPAYNGVSEITDINKIRIRLCGAASPWPIIFEDTLDLNFSIKFLGATVG